MGSHVTFSHIPAGASVFLEANCLVYAATSDAAYGIAC